MYWLVVNEQKSEDRLWEKNTFKKKKSKGLPAVFGCIKIASLERMEIVKDIEVV